MSPTESSIVSKITTEIEAAVGPERTALISDLYTFLGAAEKRIALEAKPLLSRLGAEAKIALGAAETEGKKLVGEVEAKL